MLPILPLIGSIGRIGNVSRGGSGERRAIKMADIGEPTRKIRVVPRRRLPAPPPEPNRRRSPEREPAPRRRKREKLPA
jgi:hypothetical protein